MGRKITMKALVCEMCGSHNLIKNNGMYVCENCGTKYTTEEAKKLMVEVSGSVKIDNTKKLENYYKLARRAKETNNSADAKKYYDYIRQEVPEDWEANFFAVYYQTMQCTIAEILSASSVLCECVKDTVSLIKNADTDKQFNALNEIFEYCTTIVTILYSAAWKGYNPNGYNNNPLYYKQRTPNVLYILTILGDSIEKKFGTGAPYDKLVLEIRKCDVVVRTNQLKITATQKEIDFVHQLQEKIKELEPDYVTEDLKLKKSGCYVATSIYGSYDCQPVWTLRRFRDNTLAATWYGRVFIHIYYAISPILVKWFGEKSWFKNMWKPVLDKMVRKLNSDGVKNTPYNDKKW